MAALRGIAAPLIIASQHPDGIGKQALLAKLYTAPPSSVNRPISRLSDNGSITCTQCVDDARQVTITLTPRGEERLTEIMDYTKPHVERAAERRNAQSKPPRNTDARRANRRYGYSRRRPRVR